MKLVDLNRKAVETQRDLRISLLAATLFWIGIFASLSAAQNFQIVSGSRIADIAVSENDFKVVRIAGEALAGDIELITDRRPKVTNSVSQNSIIIGTLGKNEMIDNLVQSKSIDISAIRDKRECYLITKVSSHLIIVGSDRRGTAYGVFELSKMLGVSPWVWWADSLPEKHKTLSISVKQITGHEPSVKYRGIFLNDEDWGLQRWAAKTLEPETGNIGPKTYAKICELLLRLNANTLWPAMHEVSTPFNAIPANRQVADDYAIIMGSSHAEPMLRNNVGEWKANKDDYNFVSNPKGVTEYWEQRVKENGKFENIYTIGMRGIHDSPILGTKSQADRIPLLENIFAIQRGLLSKYVNADAEKVPQIFCPYKEVLADYRAGLKVPEDVTIVFPDDNFGYIRQFPTAEEQKRKGGFGVYYHISYLGRPLSYLWLETTPPALIFEEMSKAYNNGMREFWMLNVGDIKPAEIGIEFFMQMAYDANKWNINNQDQFLKAWANREFGERNATEIAALMDKYYRLGFQRKPEHLQWYLPGEKPRKSDLTETETLERLDAYADIRRQAETVYTKIPQLQKDAFYELVLYPVRSAALANERFFAAELAERQRSENQNAARFWAERSILANSEIGKETIYFNERLASGKWRFIMSPEIGAGQWPGMRSTPPKITLDDFPVAKPLPWTDTTPSAKARARTKHIPLKPDELSVSISIEAENFTRRSDRSESGWMVIHGLGKTSDSVSIFPNAARSYTDLLATSPSLDYRISVKTSADFAANFYFVPTQPLVPGNGLRIAFSIDDGNPQIVTADEKTEVSSQKWSFNVLNQTTIATGKVRLEKGSHILRVFAVDTGVVLDKIELIPLGAGN